jgi:hypothetical protein
MCQIYLRFMSENLTLEDTKKGIKCVTLLYFIDLHHVMILGK